MTKFVDAYFAKLDEYARAGLAQAISAKAKSFRVDWDDAPFFTRAYNLSRYWDEQPPEANEDQLSLPSFPYEAVKGLQDEVGSGALAFFTSEDGVSLDDRDRWWGCAFDSGNIEAGKWVQLMIDAAIQRLEATLQKDYSNIGIELCGHDGQYPRSVDSYARSIETMRKERGYRVDALVVDRFLTLFTDALDATWLERARKL